jgi:hypothetical protein
MKRVSQHFSISCTFMRWAIRNRRVSKPTPSHVNRAALNVDSNAVPMISLHFVVLELQNSPWTVSRRDVKTNSARFLAIFAERYLTETTRGPNRVPQGHRKLNSGTSRPSCAGLNMRAVYFLRRGLCWFGPHFQFVLDAGNRYQTLGFLTSRALTRTH